MKNSSSNPSLSCLKTKLNPSEAALWFLGQAGYIIKAAGKTVVIDPYLSDSAGKLDARFSRCFPVPIRPEELEADIFIVTHDHLDHLDPETVQQYRFQSVTQFVAPRLACKKLRDLGVPDANIIRLDSGESALVNEVRITGIYALPTAPEAIDTTGYKIEFSNHRSLYFTSDTGFSDLLLSCAPSAEVLLACINGKWGNLNAEQAAKLALKVSPLYVIPNHYDMMSLNSENPKLFEYFVDQSKTQIQARTLKIMETFVWPQGIL